MLRSAFENKHLIKGMKQLSCDVVFGSPAADCMGTGVCKISAPAILFPLEDGDGFSMLIAREMMCIKLLRSQFRGGKLRLMEPYPLPSDIVLELSLKINELQPGEYTVSEENGFFKINFR
jgi:hypothetical protein